MAWENYVKDQTKATADGTLKNLSILPTANTDSRCGGDA